MITRGRLLDRIRVALAGSVAARVVPRLQRHRLFRRQRQRLQRFLLVAPTSRLCRFRLFSLA